MKPPTSKSSIKAGARGANAGSPEELTEGSRDGKIHRFASMHRHKSSRCDGPDQKSVHRIQCGMNRDASFLTFLHRYNPLYLYRIVCRRTPFNIYKCDQ